MALAGSSRTFLSLARRTSLLPGSSRWTTRSFRISKACEERLQHFSGPILEDGNWMAATLMTVRDPVYFLPSHSDLALRKVRSCTACTQAARRFSSNHAVLREYWAPAFGLPCFPATHTGYSSLGITLAAAPLRHTCDRAIHRNPLIPLSSLCPTTDGTSRVPKAKAMYRPACSCSLPITRRVQLCHVCRPSTTLRKG